jgi:hypothetical protein
VTELETIWLAVWDKLRESLNEQLVDVEWVDDCDGERDKDELIVVVVEMQGVWVWEIVGEVEDDTLTL